MEKFAVTFQAVNRTRNRKNLLVYLKYLISTLYDFLLIAIEFITYID